MRSLTVLLGVYRLRLLDLCFLRAAGHHAWENRAMSMFVTQPSIGALPAPVAVTITSWQLGVASMATLASASVAVSAIRAMVLVMKSLKVFPAFDSYGSVNTFVRSSVVSLNGIFCFAAASRISVQIERCRIPMQMP